MTTVLFHEITTLAFVLHISAGALALVSGTVALLANKGGVCTAPPEPPSSFPCS